MRRETPPTQKTAYERVIEAVEAEEDVEREELEKFKKFAA
jgi:hypothetical protein